MVQVQARPEEGGRPRTVVEDRQPPHLGIYVFAHLPLPKVDKRQWQRRTLGRRAGLYVVELPFTPFC